MEPVVIILVGVLVIAGIVGIAIGRSRARRSRAVADRQRQTAVAGEFAELHQRAGSALVRTDERIRIAEDELGFAIAEFGEPATTEFAGAVQRARQRLAEAFQLNQLISDHIEDSPEQRREWMTRIVSLCGSADQALGEQQAAFTARRATSRRTPSEIDRVRADIERVRAGVASARSTVAELAARYSDAALAPVAGNPDQAEQLLEFTERSARAAQTRLGSARDDEADAVIRAGAETLRRAEGLLDSVHGYEAEALRAEATLTAMIAESNEELAAARSIPTQERHGRIDDRIAELERALAALPASGERIDPVGSLSRVREANTALDDAVAERSQRAERNERLRAQLVTAIDDAEQQIATARSVLADYRSPIGPDARTRLAEAERELDAMTDEQDPQRALGRARRAASLAAEATARAQADMTRGGGYEQWGGPGYGRWGGRDSGRASGGAVLGGVLGGLAIGGLLDGLGDMGDLFD